VSAAPLTERVVIVAARNEADRIAETLTALRQALPGATVIVADDASTDGTAHVALQQGVQAIRGGRSVGKGGNVTRAAETVLSRAYEPDPPTFLLCDADLGESAARLVTLVEAVEAGDCDIAVAAFARRLGGGFGLAVRFARWAIERICGLRPRAPLSGQRAMRAEVFQVVVPFARGFGMELGIASDAVRAGYSLKEIELDLEHRVTGRTPRGFVHRGRQLRDLARAYLDRQHAIG
jgi:glycosyltransferase involved in cell wall biosynthesis